MFLLSKILPLFVLPLGVCLMLITWGLLRQRRRPILIALLLLLVASQPWVGRFLIRAMEGHAERPAVAAVPAVEAIVVLSIGRVVAPGPDQTSEWGDANRFFGGLELYKAGKAPMLVFTGAGGGAGVPTEGAVLAQVAQTMGVPAGAILVTGPVLNTADEARESALALRTHGLEPGTILLVTSAFHMTRARSLFATEGFDVVPFPVDFAYSANQAWTLLDVFPSIRALEFTHTALREFYGRAYYWLVSP